MRYALIKSGVVDNVIEAEPDFIAHISAAYDLILQSDVASPGDLYNGSVFLPAPPQFNYEKTMGDMYQAMQSRMVALAPWFGVFAALVQFQNWNGVKLYLQGLVSAGNILSSDSDRLVAVLNENGITL